jgi:hypothetical protein
MLASSDTYGKMSLFSHGRINMRKILMSLAVAASLAAATLFTPNTAQAYIPYAYGYNSQAYYQPAYYGYYYAPPRYYAPRYYAPRYYAPRYYAPRYRYNYPRRYYW